VPVGLLTALLAASTSSPCSTPGLLGHPDRPVLAVLGDGGLMFGSLARLSPQVAETGVEPGFAWDIDRRRAVTA
jgi:hypothetical protein